VSSIFKSIYQSYQSTMTAVRAQCGAPHLTDSVCFSFFVSQADQFAQATFANPVAAGSLLFTPGLLWEAVKQDAAAARETPEAYLARVRQRIGSFFVDPRVVNHEGTLAALRTLGEEDGEGLLQLLTGPRSVGKSLMLRKMAAQLKGQHRRVIIVDGRQHGDDIVRGIAASLAVDRALLKAVLETAPPSVAVGLSALVATVATHHADSAVDASLKAIVDSAAKESSRSRLDAELRPDQVFGAFFAACRKKADFPIIMIDEANKVLAATTDDPASRQRTLNLLDFFTRVTKQQREASIVLAASSEHGLPSRLRAGPGLQHASHKRDDSCGRGATCLRL
jgi:Cdc6-like AAA superfamily ATPase